MLGKGSSKIFKMTRFQGSDLRRQKALESKMTWKTGAYPYMWPEKAVPLHSPLIKSPQTLPSTKLIQRHVEAVITFWPVSQETERSTPPDLRVPRGSRVYNSVSSEILSKARNKGLKCSSWFPHWVCSWSTETSPTPTITKKPDFCALHRLPGWNSTNSNPKANSSLHTQEQNPCPPLLLPRDHKPRQVMLESSLELYTITLSFQGRWRGLTGPYRKWKTEPPPLAPAMFLLFPPCDSWDPVTKIFHHAASQTNIWGVMDHFHSC